jgi:hypothetical protein
VGGERDDDHKNISNIRSGKVQRKMNARLRRAPHPPSPPPLSPKNESFRGDTGVYLPKSCFHVDIQGRERFPYGWLVERSSRRLRVCYAPGGGGEACIAVLCAHIIHTHPDRNSPYSSSCSPPRCSVTFFEYSFSSLR